MSNNGIFTISLDFELHWGGFEKWPLHEGNKAYFIKTRESIPPLLSLFQQAEVHATWATVGLLMHRNIEELQKNVPQEKPSYDARQLSAYQYMEQGELGDSEALDPFHYAGSLIDRIKEVSGQEIGTHTFAHYYCNEPGQRPEQFEDDLRAAKKAARPYQVLVNSLVFPRNQYNAAYLKICNEEGIKIVRVNPLDWWWQIDSTQQESKWKRLNRGLDAYFSIGGKTSYPLEAIERKNGVILMPASRLLRPFHPREFFLNELKIKKIKKEMTLAAQNREVYHLWWHPHNFGHYTPQNMEGLVEIVNHFQKLHHDYDMISLNMGEIANVLNYGVEG